MYKGLRKKSMKVHPYPNLHKLQVGKFHMKFYDVNSMKTCV